MERAAAGPVSIRAARDGHMHTFMHANESQVRRRVFEACARSGISFNGRLSFRRLRTHFYCPAPVPSSLRGSAALSQSGIGFQRGQPQ